MDDLRIVQLFWDRSEDAISQSDLKYGNYLGSIAYNILQNREDTEESVSDTYMDAWNSMPPHKPTILSTFLGKITRRISIDRWRARNAARRGGGEVTLALQELEECIASPHDVHQEIERKELAGVINSYLESLPQTERRVFLRRYWYADSIQDIALRFGFSQSKVASMLHRTRLKLREHLSREGY